MKNQPDRGVCNYGAGVIGRFAAALRQEVGGVRLGQDIEAIHRMRVASRRLRSALPLFENCYAQKYRLLWRKEIRQVTRALGAARDTDVQIDRLERCLVDIPDPHFRPGIRRLILRLSQKRAKLQVNVVQALDDLEKSQALDSLEARTAAIYVEPQPGEPYSSSLYTLAKLAILDSLDRFMSYETYITNPDAVAELHAMRIASKQLRYTLEIFGPIYANGLKSALSTVKSAQEMLGDIHDSDVWKAYLPQFLDKERQRIVRFYGAPGPINLLVPGITYFQENRLQFRERVYRDYLEAWNNWKTNAIWETLVETIDLPTRLVQQQVFYPAIPQLEPQAPVEENDHSNTD